MLGGRVLHRGEAAANDLYLYRGTVVSGRHAVFEDGLWLRVQDSALARRAPAAGMVTVYPVITERHLLVLPEFIAADNVEVDEIGLSDLDRIARLNAIENDDVDPAFPPSVSVPVAEVSP